MESPNYKIPGVPAMDVLDHGFVALRNIAGPTPRRDNQFDAHDRDPAQAARMSFDQMNSDRTEQQDLKLADYLIRNRHTSPFEMVDVWLEMKLPIFVARQFVRHRTVSLNEVSARYVQLAPEWYIPEIVGAAPTDKKQGQVDTLSLSLQRQFQRDLNIDCRRGYDLYDFYIGKGVAPEHARLFLHVNHYTHWLWKQNLHNIMHFLMLRNHSHAQVEAQLYAKATDKLIRAQLPCTMDLFDKYRKMD